MFVDIVSEEKKKRPHWVVNDLIRGFRYWMCSSCGEGYFSEDCIGKDTCPHCKKLMDLDANEYL